METKIGEVKGFTITYDSYDKLFHLKDAEGGEAGQGKTQEEVEAQADKLAKAGWSFPIPALIVDVRTLEAGKVTSVNLGDRSCYFVYSERGHYRSREKVRLNYSHTYEVTPGNEAIQAQMKEKATKIKTLETEIDALKEGLEKPIDLDYFGLEERY